MLAKLRLEPAVFIFFVCYGVFFATSQQLYIEKACKVRLDINHLILGGNLEGGALHGAMLYSVLAIATQ